ncbi:hypothetical protein ACVXZ0_00855 [Staphylococcus aureus]
MRPQVFMSKTSRIKSKHKEKWLGEVKTFESDETEKSATSLVELNE